MYGAQVQFLVQSQMPLGTPKNKTLLNMIQIWKCDKYLQSGGIPAFIPQILTQTGPGGRLLAWEGVGGGRDRAAPHARPRLHPPGVLPVSPRPCSSVPPSHLPTVTLLFPSNASPPAMHLVLALDVDDHREAICLKLETAQYSPRPGFGRSPGEGLLGQEP